MEELDQLKKKLQKDISDSAHRIGSVQKEIQELVHERKEKSGKILMQNWKEVFLN